MQPAKSELTRSLGLFDSTMLVAGSMIGSGIFIVSADIARQVGSPGWLLVVWLITGFLTVTAALSYGELAAMMPKAGGQYVYLREAYSPFWGFLYGWTLFAVIQTATIAAVAVGFGRYAGVLVPWISETNYLIEPIILNNAVTRGIDSLLNAALDLLSIGHVHLSGTYAISLSTAQVVGIVMIALLTWMNTRGLKLGKFVQNVFTFAKTGSLIALIALGLIVGLLWHGDVAAANFGDLWSAVSKNQARKITPGKKANYCNR